MDEEHNPWATILNTLFYLEILEVNSPTQST